MKNGLTNLKRNKMEQYLEICVAVLMTMSIAISIVGFVFICIIIKDYIKIK